MTTVRGVLGVEFCDGFSSLNTPGDESEEVRRDAKKSFEESSVEGETLDEALEFWRAIILGVNKNGVNDTVEPLRFRRIGMNPGNTRPKDAEDVASTAWPRSWFWVSEGRSWRICGLAMLPSSSYLEDV